MAGMSLQLKRSQFRKLQSYIQIKNYLKKSKNEKNVFINNLF